MGPANDKASMSDEREREKLNSYPHMCRDGHVQIGHSDSEHEMCPLCRAKAENERLREAIKEWKDAEYEFDKASNEQEVMHPDLARRCARAETALRGTLEQEQP